MHWQEWCPLAFGARRSYRNAHSYRNAYVHVTGIAEKARNAKGESNGGHSDILSLAQDARLREKA